MYLCISLLCRFQRLTQRIERAYREVAGILKVITCQRVADPVNAVVVCRATSLPFIAVPFVCQVKLFVQSVFGRALADVEPMRHDVPIALLVGPALCRQMLYHKALVYPGQSNSRRVSIVVNNGALGSHCQG